MIIELAVTNYRSIKARQVFSMLPSTRVKNHPALLQSLTYPTLSVQPSAVIYGANNAGKSNLLKSLYAFKWLVTQSAKLNSDDPLKMNEYFWFDTQTQKTPTTFELDFIADNELRYNYQVSFDEQHILKEALYCFNLNAQQKVTIATLFVREADKPIKFGEGLRGKKKEIESKLNPNQLFLSKADADGHTQLQPVYRFFAQKLQMELFLSAEESDSVYSIKKTLRELSLDNQDVALQEFIENILLQSQTGILALELAPAEVTHLRTELPHKSYKEFKTVHKLFEGKKEIGMERIALSKESVGTHKLIAVSGLFYNALKKGQILVIDELDKSLHSLLTQTLIQLFHDPKTNPNQAQLIFTTHDATLWRAPFLSRGQKWILEKDETGATEIYSLADLTGVREKASFEDLYLSGRLGGTPIINKQYMFNQTRQWIRNGKTEI
jgi:AAA15 family ATPase/GTPase